MIAGNPPSPMGELAQAAFHFAQLQYPYHAMRMAVTTAHMAFVRPTIIVEAMDAIVAGWSAGRASANLHFVRWEEQFDTPLQDIRDRFGVPVTGAAV